MVDYKSSHTGNQIDTIVTTVTNNEAKVKYGNIIGTLSNQVDLRNALNTKLTASDIIDTVISTATDKALSANMGRALQDQINSIGARGKYLSEWNCTTGLPETNPTILPYVYETGSYFIVGTVGATNYKPSGTQYTGSASTEIETSTVAVNDTYLFDGSTWKLLHGADIQVTFSSIAGQPTDNANLASALNTKQNTLVSGTNIKTINSTSLLGSGNLTVDSLPAQSGQSGKFLTTNGTTASWADTLPSQSGQSGKYLTTDGSSASWADAEIKNDHALKGYLDEGELLTDAEGLADVEYYNRSTFDKSKFTVVGSPTITDDGIASGFSAYPTLYTGSYVTITNNYNLSQPFISKIKYKISGNPTHSTHGIIGHKSTDYSFSINLRADNKYAISMSSNGTSLDLASFANSSTVSIINDKYYYIIFSFDGSKYILQHSEDDISYTTVYTLNSSNTLHNPNKIYLGVGEYTDVLYRALNGSIDLKAFSITVDSKEVFNGNKTGIDQIKANNYTVVGSPTITDDGIASGFSSSNFLKTPNVSAPTTSFVQKIKFNIGNATSSDTDYIFNTTISQCGAMLAFNPNYDLYWQLGSTAFGWDIVNRSTGYTLSPSTDYVSRIRWNGTTYYCEISIDGGSTYTVVDSVTSSVAIGAHGVVLGGIVSGVNPFTTGSIDLNSFKIYVDGNLVYQPTLRIPYNQSKTGSKIVNSYYRDRVQDMYEQFGWANYYTLNEGINFTLPQGELYGLIQKNKGYRPDLFDTKWSDHILSDVQWLRADTFSWQSGTTYSNAYNHLVSDISGITSETETIGSYTVTFYRATDGHKICLADQETTVNNIYTESGIAWYYILDTTNTRFKLPRTKWGFEGLRTNVGDYISETLPDHQHYLADLSTGVNSATSSNKDESMSYGVSYSNNWSYTLAYGANDADGLRSGKASVLNSTYQDSAAVQERATQMYLYFYVGEFTQSAIEQTAGLNAELLNSKLDTTSAQAQAPYLKTSYINGTAGYNIWSNGYCEQWGQINATNGTVVTFLKNYTDTNYNVEVNVLLNTSGYAFANATKTSSQSITFSMHTTEGGTYTNDICWKASGYLASGEY